MRILSIGELLWDVFPDAERIGGAPFNFAAHARRLGHEVVFLSAVGEDHRGRRAREEAARVGLPVEFLQVVTGAPTGYVSVTTDGAGQPEFVIHRPAAYDLLEPSPRDWERIEAFGPDWIAFGTLHQVQPLPRAALDRLLAACPAARCFYDINLRPGCYERELLEKLMRRASVCKLNDAEVAEVEKLFSTPHRSLEEFCRDYAGRYGWEAVCVTRGAEGCVVLTPEGYSESPGCKVKVADTVGAGDAFSAAFVHGLGEGWPPERVAGFANRVGALIASRPGAVPDWSPAEV